MVSLRAWVLNLDADDELARPQGYTPSRGVLARTIELSQKIGSLLAPGDVLVGAGTRIEIEGAPVEGRAWCPTPRALRLLEQAGARLPAAPRLEVLRRVNHRRFSAELGQTLPGAIFALTRDEIDAVLRSPSPSGTWLLKRPFGYTGRGRRKAATGEMDASLDAWLAASLSTGEGLQVEPLVERAGDFALHGFLSNAGELTLGDPTRQVMSETGAWLATVRASERELDELERRALIRETERAADALVATGYFGPFCVDSFRWLDAQGIPHWNPRCEINARYSMGWATGMGARRPDLVPHAAL